MRLFWATFKHCVFKKAWSLHGVWKSQKKSHSTLRVKRATFTFWVDKSWLKMPKMVHFGEFLKTRCLRSNSVTRQVSFIRTKMPKFKNSNATFWAIFKQCVFVRNWVNWQEMSSASVGPIFLHDLLLNTAYKMFKTCLLPLSYTGQNVKEDKQANESQAIKNE